MEQLNNYKQFYNSFLIKNFLPSESDLDLDLIFRNQGAD